MIDFLMVLIPIVGLVLTAIDEQRPSKVIVAGWQSIALLQAIAIIMN